MYRLLGLLLLALGVLALSGVTAQPVRAGPRSPLLRLDVTTTDLSGDEESSILVYLEATFDTRREIADEWKCVAKLPGETAVAPLASDIDVYTLITPNPEEQGGFIVSVRLVIRGQGGPRWAVGTVPAAGIRPDIRDLVLRETAGNLLDGLLKANSACQATVKLEGKQRIETAVGSFETSYSGAALLTLDGDGTFAASMTVSHPWRLVGGAGPVSVTGSEGGLVGTAPDVTCTTTPEPSTFTLDLAGGYRAQDGSLVFSRLHATTSGYQITVRCVTPVGSYSSTTSQPGSETDSLALLGGELAVALSAGATLELPRPAGVPGEYEVRLTLAYGSDGAAVSTVPRNGAAVARLP